jgi:hypothetical protein
VFEACWLALALAALGLAATWNVSVAAAVFHHLKHRVA